MGPVPLFPQDAALHSEKIVNEMIAFLRARWKHEFIEGDPGELFPGDIVATLIGKYAGHMLVVGPKKNVLWHAINDRNGRTGKICRTSYGWARNKGIRAVYRMEVCKEWHS